MKENLRKTVKSKAEKKTKIQYLGKKKKKIREGHEPEKHDIRREKETEWRDIKKKKMKTRTKQKRQKLKR